MFGDVLDKKKQAPLDYKNISFTWLPNWMFPKGLISDFCQKC